MVATCPFYFSQALRATSSEVTEILVLTSMPEESLGCFANVEEFKQSSHLYLALFQHHLLCAINYISFSSIEKAFNQREA